MEFNDGKRSLDALDALAITAEKAFMCKSYDSNTDENNHANRSCSPWTASKTLTDNSNHSRNSSRDSHNENSGRPTKIYQLVNSIDNSGISLSFLPHKLGNSMAFSPGYSLDLINNATETETNTDYISNKYRSNTESDMSSETDFSDMNFVTLKEKYLKMKQKLQHYTKRKAALEHKLTNAKSKIRILKHKNKALDSSSGARIDNVSSLKKEQSSLDIYEGSQDDQPMAMGIFQNGEGEKWCNARKGLRASVSSYTKDFDVSCRYAHSPEYEYSTGKNNCDTHNKHVLEHEAFQSRKSTFAIRPNVPTLQKRSKTFSEHPLYERNDAPSNTSSIRFEPNPSSIKYNWSENSRVAKGTSEIFNSQFSDSQQDRFGTKERESVRFKQYRFPQKLDSYAYAKNRISFKYDIQNMQVNHNIPSKTTSYLQNNCTKNFTRFYNSNLNQNAHNDSRATVKDQYQGLKPTVKGQSMPNKGYLINAYNTKSYSRYTIGSSNRVKGVYGMGMGMGMGVGVGVRAGIPSVTSKIGQRAIIAPRTNNYSVLGKSINRQFFSGRIRRRHAEMNSRIRSVQPVGKDENGNYILPVQVGILTVLSLGKVVYKQPNFHNERYIWPVGYMVQREYYSMVEPAKQVIYICRVAENSDGPRFIIECEDMPNNPIVANTATGAWTTVVKRVNSINNRNHSNSASGPDYFGFSHPTIAKMIQDLPNALKCKNYISQRFVVMKDRHVRGVLKKGRGGKPDPELIKRGQKALEIVAAASIQKQ